MAAPPSSNSCHTPRATSLERGLLPCSSSSPLVSDDETLFSTPSNSLDRLGPGFPAPAIRRRSPSPRPHPPPLVKQHQQQHSSTSLISPPSQSQSALATTTATNPMISPPPAAAPLNRPLPRNNSSASMASSSAAMYFQARVNSLGGTNGVLGQPTMPVAKRSHAGLSNGGLPHPQQHFPLLPQQQQQFGIGTSRFLLQTAALNNLQQQGSEHGHILSGITAASGACPPESCADSAEGENSIVGGAMSAGGGGGSSSPNSSSKTKRKKSSHTQPSGGFLPQQLEPLEKHRGELSINEKYRYDLSRAQLKASSRTSALLSGFAMIALVELQYVQDTPKPLLILLAVVTTLLVSVHLLALMMSTCLLPYIEANGCTQDSPHIKLKFYIELSWIFSTCIGLVLFLLEIGVIFFVKFNAIGYNFAAYITTGMLVPVLIIFMVISYLIHRNRFTHSIERVNDKVVDLQKYLVEADVNNIPQSNSIQRNVVNAGLQGVTVIRNFKE